MAFRGAAAVMLGSSASSAVVAMTATITGITQASSAVMTVNTVSQKAPFSVNTQFSISGVGGMTQVNGNTYTATAVGGSSGAWTYTLNVNSTAFTAYTSGGTATLAVQLNDIIVSVWGAGGSAPTFTWPSGFNTIGSFTKTTNSANGATDNVECRLKVATGSEPTSYTFTSSVSNFQSVQVRIYSGRNSSSPVTASTQAGVASATTPVTIAATGVTAASGDDVVVMVAGSQTASTGTDTVSLTAPTGYTAEPYLSCVDTLQFSPIMASYDDINVSAGSTGTIGGTIAPSGSYGFSYQAYVISLAVASAGTVYTPFTRTDFYVNEVVSHY